MSRRPKAKAKVKVLVSGCYDLIHAGHVVFLETAAQYGDLYVCIGSDANVEALKHHRPLLSQEERRYIVQSIRFVHEARISSGRGMLDFEPDLEEIRPDIFIVNEDGHTEDKRRLCQEHGVQYVVLPRIPKPGLSPRSSTDLKGDLQRDRDAELEKILPYRICLAGGWLDQPFVSRHHPGPVITLNIHPTRRFSLRCGMATSSREVWKRIAPYGIFEDDPVELARLLFGYENPPGSRYISGSQDHLGLTLPGANRLYYDGKYWPDRIESIVDEATCDWLERSIAMAEMSERPPGYDPLAQQNITRQGAGRLARAAETCWEGIVAKDIRKLGEGLTGTHRAWAEILPLTTSRQIEEALDAFRSYGRITSGCGGGYAVLATDEDVPGGFRVSVRRGLGDTGGGRAGGDRKRSARES